MSRPSDCHPERPAHVRGQCQRCYRREHGRNREVDKDAELRRMYGISLAEMRLMLKNQEHRCMICGRPLDGLTKTSTPHVDHSHATGVVRGLLCDPCNVMLGRADDDPAILRRAADYLEGTLG